MPLAKLSLPNQVKEIRETWVNYLIDVSPISQTCFALRHRAGTQVSQRLHNPELQANLLLAIRRGTQVSQRLHRLELHATFRSQSLKGAKYSFTGRSTSMRPASQFWSLQQPLGQPPPQTLRVRGAGVVNCFIFLYLPGAPYQECCQTFQQGPP